MAKVKKEEENESYFSDRWLRECVEMEKEVNKSIKVEQIKKEEESCDEFSDCPISDDEDHGDTEEMEVDDPEQIERQESNQTATNISADENDVCHSDNGVREEHKTPAIVVDSVENLCKYKCQLCSCIFRCRKSFGTHLSKSKHSVGDIHRKDTSNYMVKTVFHRCKVCKKVILCDKDIIRKHAVTHNLSTLDQYTKMTSQERERLQQIFKDSKKDNLSNYFHCKEFLRIEAKKVNARKVMIKL